MNRLTESETKKANMLASMIDCSPHEWPNSSHEIQLICHGYLDRVDDNQALRERLAAVEAERDAARAGEARAVEALDVFARAYRVSMLPFAPGIDEADGAHHWMPHGWPSVADFKQANAALTDSSALDWLAQQRRDAAVEALEGIGAKQTSASGPAAQKVETLIFLADTADKLARLDCELIDRATMAQRAALFREAAAMMRERGDSGWTAQFEREHKGRTLTITEAKPGGWYWYVDAFPDYSANLADTLEAAQAAAIAWVDEQEGK